MSGWYGDWVKRHARVFGITAEPEIAAMLSWHDALNATADELNAATNWLTANLLVLARHEARFLGKAALHLAVLIGRLKDARAVQYQRNWDTYAQDHGECSLCGGSGWVSVPHIVSVRDGDWLPLRVTGTPTYRTMVVTCTCPLGRWKWDRVDALFKDGNSGQRHLSLDEYHRVNPRWQTQLKHHQREQTAQAALNPAGAELREQLAGIAKRI